MHELRTYIFAGGGTGGHLFPGIAVAEELLARQPAARVLFVGSDRAIERRILAAAAFEHRALTVDPSSLLCRRPWVFARRWWRAYYDSQDVLNRTRPAAVIGLGGYASVPMVLAASRRRIPVLLLEQNRTPGRATIRLHRRASAICVSFAGASLHFSGQRRVTDTGNPVRRCVAALREGAAARAAGKPPTLLVLGGSQGAQALNAAMLEAAARLHPALAAWRIVHQTGAEQEQAVAEHYHRLGQTAEVRAFFDDLPQRLASADLAVSRAGATTLAELACGGCPAILVPFPNSFDNHQALNAQFYAAAGAARIVLQDRTPARFHAELERQLRPLLLEESCRRAMQRNMAALARPDAAARVVDVLMRLCPAADGGDS